MSICPICGSEAPEGKSFCSSCGERLGTSSSSDADQPESTANPQRRRWLAAAGVIAVLAVGGAAAGYLAGSLGQEDNTENTAGGQSVTVNDQDAAEAVELPEVICRTGTFPDYQFEYLVEPRECDLLVDGDPVDADSTATTEAQDLRWLVWDADMALAEGNIFMPSVGPRPYTIKLFRPRRVCGRTVFTRSGAAEPGAEVVGNSPITDCIDDE